MMTMSMLVASAAAYAVDSSCFEGPYTGMGLDPLVPPYIFTKHANGSYTNAFPNGTVIQTGVVDSTRYDDGACLITASALVPGAAPARLVVRAYRNPKFGGFDVCYEVGEQPVMPKNVHRRKVLRYVQGPAGPTRCVS